MSFTNTIAQLIAENQAAAPDQSAAQQCMDLELTASDSWKIFQLQYTAGVSLIALADALEQVVVNYERWIDALADMPDEDYYPPFILNDMIDTYVHYLNMASAAVLLRREDLVPRICAFNDGTDFEQSDAVLEELFRFFLPDRPELNVLLWKTPYLKLLDAIDSDSPGVMAAEMKNYVKSWYPGMKGKAHFWGKHEKIKPEFTPYYGYWAMCAGAFTFLYGIDDAGYRDQIVYPKDLVNYARSIPGTADAQATGMRRPLRLAGGQACTRSGVWFTPVKADSQARFEWGDVLPDFPDAPYGLTIWQFMGD
nr:PoNe immunity protein domain-containing protein [uncultured Duganella sp.]